MKKSTKFSLEVRERAVRMVQGHRGEYSSLSAAIESIAPKIGCVPPTLNDRVRRHDIDSGSRETVEPVFGIIKQVMGWHQMSMRGLDKSEGEWSLVALGWSIRRLHVLRAA